MKNYLKYIALFMTTVLIICGIAACGGGSSKPSEDSGEVKEEQSSTTTEESEDSNSEEKSFHDNLFEDDEVKIEITKYEVIPAGDKKYSEYNYEEKPVIAFWYKVTNKTSNDVDPSTAWILRFRAIQDNDPNKINELDVSSLPDDKYLDSQSETIKEGGTVECCCGYLLDDQKTPVTLKATDIVGNDYGSQDYAVK